MDRDTNMDPTEKSWEAMRLQEVDNAIKSLVDADPQQSFEVLQQIRGHVSEKKFKGLRNMYEEKSPNGAPGLYRRGQAQAQTQATQRESERERERHRNLALQAAGRAQAAEEEARRAEEEARRERKLARQAEVDERRAREAQRRAREEKEESLRRAAYNQEEIDEQEENMRLLHSDDDDDDDDHRVGTNNDVRSDVQPISTKFAINSYFVSI